MKIALVSPYDYAYPGGVTAHISHLQENFIRMGHSAKILAPSSRAVDTLGDNIITIGKPVSIPASGSIVRISVSPRLAGRVKATLREEQFDIIHLHEPLLPALPLTVLRFSQSINIGTFHAYRNRSLGYFYMRRLLKRWFRKLDGKIAVSKSAMGFVSRYFQGYYNVISNGIDLEHFSADVPPIEEYNDGKLNILFVGRLEKRKGLKYLLAAYERIRQQLPNSRLIVVGPDGGRLKSHERFIRGHSLESVVFTGYVSYEELPRYYKTADVFCAPATGKESFGIVLLEAMAASRPIVASHIEGYAGVVTDGEEGMLVEPENEEALASSLVHLLTNKQLREKMGAMGRLKAEMYSWRRIASQVMSYYERLLSEIPNKKARIKPN